MAKNCSCYKTVSIGGDLVRVPNCDNWMSVKDTWKCTCGENPAVRDNLWGHEMGPPTPPQSPRRIKVDYKPPPPLRQVEGFSEREANLIGIVFGYVLGIAIFISVSKFLDWL